jgi:hypothetical protein
MSGAGAGLVLGLLSSIITIIETTYQLYEAVEDEKGLPANFKKAASKLPLISKILTMQKNISNPYETRTRKLRSSLPLKVASFRQHVFRTSLQRSCQTKMTRGGIDM